MKLADELATMDRRQLSDLAKEKDLERRDQERTEKNAKEDKEQDKKAQHAIQLAMMPIKTRSGRSPVRRMLPFKLENREKGEETLQQQQAQAAADADLFYGELWD
jgi:hypothetical protein